MNKRWYFIFFLIILVLVVLYILFGGKTEMETVQPTATISPSLTTEASKTLTPTLTATIQSTATSTMTPTPTPTELACFELISPEDGFEFGAMGLISFEWSDQEGVEVYKLVIQQPNGYNQDIETDETEFEKWLESIPLGGEYIWEVSALDSSDTEVCQAGPWGFSKIEFVPTATPDFQGSSNNSSSGSSSEIPDCWGATCDCGPISQTSCCPGWTKEIVEINQPISCTDPLVDPPGSDACSCVYLVDQYVWQSDCSIEIVPLISMGCPHG